MRSAHVRSPRGRGRGARGRRRAGPRAARRPVRRHGGGGFGHLVAHAARRCRGRARRRPAASAGRWCGCRRPVPPAGRRLTSEPTGPRQLDAVAHDHDVRVADQRVELERRPTPARRAGARWRGSGRADRRPRRRRVTRVAPRRRRAAASASSRSVASLSAGCALDRRCRAATARSSVVGADGVEVADEEVGARARARATCSSPESAATTYASARERRRASARSTGSPPANTSASIVTPTARGHADDGKARKAPCAGMTRIRF